MRIRTPRGFMGRSLAWVEWRLDRLYFFVGRQCQGDERDWKTMSRSADASIVGSLPKNLRLIVTFALYTGIAFSQGICIPRPIKSSTAEGIVYFGSERHPLADVRVDITGYAYGAPVVASSTTGKDGRFSIASIKPGRYRLNAKHPAVGHMDVEFRVPSFWRAKRRLLIVIGDDPSKGACWGGYAKTVKIADHK